MIKSTLLFLLLVSGIVLVDSPVAVSQWKSTKALSSEYILKIDFRSAEEGYMITSKESNGLGDTLWKTTSYGKQWSVVLPKDHPSKIADFALVKGEIWLCIYDDSPSHIRRSTDGGSSFVPVEFDSAVFPVQISFHSPSIAYVAAWNDSASSSGGQTIYLTTNGGSSWIPRSSVPTDGTHLMTGYGAGTLMVSRSDPQAHQEKNVLSLDSGVSWILGSESSVAYCGDKTWVSEDKRSTDDGLTWQMPQSSSLETWSDTTGDVIQALFPGYVRISTDYGVTWNSEQYNPAGIQPFYLSVVDSLHAYAISSDQHSGRPFILYSRSSLAGIGRIEPTPNGLIYPNPCATGRLAIELPDQDLEFIDGNGRVYEDRRLINGSVSLKGLPTSGLLIRSKASREFLGKVINVN